MMLNGKLIKSQRGLFYVKTSEGSILECKTRGKLRQDGITPLVGDNVTLMDLGEGKGHIESICQRKNCFIRPAVANIDQLIVIAAAVIPITDPFLIDRVSVIAQLKNVEVIVCINKCDENPGDDLFKIYTNAGFKTIRTSAITDEGVDLLKAAMTGKVSAMTGNSGVGKSSLINCIQPELNIKTDAVSDKLGRGKHTTRHIELIDIPGVGLIADTPGFSSFEADYIDPILPEELPGAFIDFIPYLDDCRFSNCSHTKEKDCGVLRALDAGKIEKSRHESYLRLLRQAKEIKPWELSQH